MKAGDKATVGGEEVTILGISDEDGWVQVQYADGDMVWTMPEAVHVKDPS
jgi:uncharacterized protein YgiM (DUF1202 family)